MDDLIAALQLLRKYGNPRLPTHCEHDIMYVCGIAPAAVSTEDKARLENMGFIISNESGEDQFVSYRYGSA